MRRKDREITDPAQIEDIISRCACCRIGFYDDGEVYIVPLNFGYESKDGAYVFYFHGAKAGRKFELIQKEPAVGFEMDTGYALTEGKGDAACGYSARFQSVVGNGTMSLVTGPEEKRRGLTLLMNHSAGKRNWAFDQKSLDAAAVFRLTVSKLSCKEHP